VIRLSFRSLARTFLLFLLPVMAAACARAQQPVEPWLAPHFSVDAKSLYQAASAVRAPDGAHVAILVEQESYSFDASGRMVHAGYFVYKILDQEGAEGWDSLAVNWEPWHQARPEIRARVIAPDFSVKTLDPSSITEEPERGGDYKIYSDGKRLHAPLPAIAPGVVVEEEYTVRETVPLFAQGQVTRVELGAERVPVEHTLVVIDAPASLPMHTATLQLPGLQPVRSEANGRVTLTYQVGRLEGIDPADPNLPPDVVRYPEIEFSTGESWQRVAAAYAAIVDILAKESIVKPLVGKLVAGEKSDADKEMAILSYLDTQVRYTGIEFGEAALVPHALTEVLANKYGDCKDKATLLVTMLRAAGIPAYVALLNAGSRMDVPPDLPGMGQFDHAIVYVPGSPALWIDATDRYARLGELPAADQGRLALIAGPETTALVSTPQSTSKDNVLREFRDFTLGESGPASVIERVQPTGVFESVYRAYYADMPDKDTRDLLHAYVKSEYASDDLTKVDRTDPADLSQQFQLTLACDKAKRGYTDIENAQAVIRVDSLFRELPSGLKQKEDPDAAKKEGLDKPKKPRTADWELDQPFSADWSYRIVPPDGFVPRELPKDVTIPIGPAVLTETYKIDKDGAVLAHLSFDSVKRRYTVAEAAVMRNKVADLIDGPPIVINFEPEGAVLLRQGKVSEALASYRALIVRHPNQGIYHLQLADVLLQAGMGEAARAEARLAVKLDPTSAAAERGLADVLKHDLVGREMRAGSDLSGAADAYRAAIKLDPNDHIAQGNLAILLEYDPDGLRYGSQAKMKEAIAEYKALGPDELADLGIQNNLAYALFYGGEYAEAYKAAQDLNPQPTALIAASEAMLQGSKAGLAEINKRSTSEDDYKSTALTAANMLMRIRQYPQTADFLDAGASGDNAAWAMGLASTLQPAKHHEDIQFANTPGDIARRYWLVTHDPDLTQAKLEAVLSRNARIVLEKQDPAVLKRTLESGKVWDYSLVRNDNSSDVEIDIDMQEAQPKGEGSDTTGYREKLGISGMANPVIFVVKEDGVYKILGTSDEPDAIALEILGRIGAGDLNGAKVLLDWLREDVHLEGGDDPLGGRPFPHFWTRGEPADAQRMKLAAASILVSYKPTVDQGIKLLEEARRQNPSEPERTNILLALAHGYTFQQNFSALLDVSPALLKQFPESMIALSYNEDALMGLGRFDEAMALADQRLKLLDGDTDALTMKSTIEAACGDYAADIQWAQKAMAQDNSSAGLLNMIAWYSLFTGKVTGADIATAIKAVQMDNTAPDFMHTLACLYAVTGKTGEAHDLLLRAMDMWNLEGPDDDFWYAFGLIAEQYGERDIAIADYRKLQKPKYILAIPESSWKLAQMRLKALNADQAAGGK
jgi:transglutaminase-like putative cysteine protease/Flp pilus assembly protein TadD